MNHRLLSLSTALTVFSLTACTAALDDTAPAAELGTREQELGIPQLCAIVANPVESLENTLEYRFDPTVRCPLASLTLTDVPSERIDGVDIFINADKSPRAGGVYNYATRTTYTITGTKSLFIPNRNGVGGKWIEFTEVIAQGETWDTFIYHRVDDEAYDSIKVKLKTEETSDFCYLIPSGQRICRGIEVTGKLGATLLIVPDEI